MQTKFLATCAPEVKVIGLRNSDVPETYGPILC